MKLAILTSDNREIHRQYDNPVPWFGTAPEALLQGFRNYPDLEVHVVSCTQRLMTSPAKLAENIYFHSLHVPKIGWMRTLYQGCIRATRRKLRELRPDIVHGQGTERECAISAVLSGFPNVVTIHGNMAALARQFHARWGSFYWLTAKIENWTLPRSGGVLCNSAYTEEQVRRRNPRTWRVANALREPFFSSVPDTAVPPPVQLINVGVISARKRQAELLAALRNLHGRGYSFQVDFVGGIDRSSSYGSTFLREMERPGTGDYASFSGVQDTAALIGKFDASSACIHFPSEEAFGLVVAEALARNLKVFVTDVGGPIEIIENVEGAEIFEPNDWAGLENALARWMDKGASRPHTAAQTMAERYHPKVIARRHVEIYEEVVSIKPALNKNIGRD